MTIQDWFEKRKEAQIKRRELEARAEVEQNPTRIYGLNAYTVMPSF